MKCAHKILLALFSAGCATAVPVLQSCGNTVSDIIPAIRRLRNAKNNKCFLKRGYPSNDLVK